MKILVAGHSLIINSNRKFWSVFAKKTNSSVDLICPSIWSSNLSKSIYFSKSIDHDANISNLWPIPVSNKGSGSFFFYSPFKTFEILSQSKYDAIYLNQETWAFSTFLFVLIKQFTLNRHTQLFLCVAQNIKKSNLSFLHIYERFISKYIFAFLYCSDGVKEVLRWKGINNPCIYFPLPYDDSTYISHEPDHKLSSIPFTLGYLGRLSADKGLILLLEVLDELNRNSLQYQLLIGGSGPLISDLRARSYVKYLGLIPHDQAHKFYEQIDCFVLPSQTLHNWKEQFGRVIVESFGAGKPVIGSSSGSIPEVLKILNWNFIFKENSAGELRENIIKMSVYLKSQDGKDHLRKSTELNKLNFSQSAVAVKLHAQIQSLLYY